MRVDIVAYRWADYDTPLWVNANRSGGRYHCIGDPPTQYWALHPLGPWAELLRFLDFRNAALVAELRHRVWAARFSERGLRIINFDDATAVGIEPEDLVDDDWTACQDLAAELRTSVDGIIVPSAALPGTQSLVLFGERVAAPYQLEPVSTDLDVPTAVSADGARPPTVLLDWVRWRGTAHAGLEAWRAGAELPPISPFAVAVGGGTR